MYIVAKARLVANPTGLGLTPDKEEVYSGVVGMDIVRLGRDTTDDEAATFRGVITGVVMVQPGVINLQVDFVALFGKITSHHLTISKYGIK